ncbi:hypothetical protein REPUB_Repub17cG0094200 [Reevesia pubescens]
MAFAKTAVIFLFMMALCGVSMGAVHWVGGFAGWTIPAGSLVDYRKWATTRNFHVGDVAVFNYNKELHNVVRVTHQNFKSCNATSPISVYSSGSDTIELTRPGHFYFICGLPGHCLSGQKVHIQVTQLGQVYLPIQSFASLFNDHQLPHSASASASLAPGPAQSSAPSDLKLFNFWLVLALGGVLAFGFGVTGIDY